MSKELEKTRAILPATSCAKFTATAAEKHTKKFFWCCRGESEKGAVTVISYDNSLVRTSNIWLDIVIY